MLDRSFYTLKSVDSPILAIALHDGHYIDPELRPFQLLNEAERAREEDPYTGFMITDLPVTTLRVHSSRFQLDLNRFWEKAIYEEPEDAWGLKVWSKKLAPEWRAQLQENYRKFQQEIDSKIKSTIQQYGCFIILDVHSYNYKRQSPFQVLDEQRNPEMNLGTWYNNLHWKPLCNRYESFLKKTAVNGHLPDVRQNVAFKGGGFAQQVLAKYSNQGCVISIEFKKTFMDEWTGVATIPHLLDLRNLLKVSVPFLYNEL